MKNFLRKSGLVAGIVASGLLSGGSRCVEDRGPTPSNKTRVRMSDDERDKLIVDCAIANTVGETSEQILKVFMDCVRKHPSE